MNLTQKRNYFLCILFILLFLALTGCERADPVEPETPTSSFSDIQSTIFDQSCAFAGCHLGASAPFGLDLSSGNSYGNLVNVPSGEVPSLMRVKPNDPDNSYLVQKLEGNPNIQGQRMPLGGQPLSQDQIDAVRQWISEGAPDN